MASTNIDIKVAQLDQLDVAELTTKSLTGTGVFDVLMASVSLHIKEEHKQNRIRGTEYSQVYLGGLQATLASSIEYLNKSKTLGIEIANQELQGELLKAQADQIRAEVDVKLPAEVDGILANTALTTANKDRVLEEVKLVPLQGELLESQVAESTYRVENMLPKELEQITAQIENLSNQGELTAAQTEQVIAETTTRLPAEVEGIRANTDLIQVNKDRAQEELKLIPVQKDLLSAQVGQAQAEVTLTDKRVEQITAELTKVPVEIEMLRQQIVNTTTQNELIQSQVEGSDLQNSKVPKELELLDKQALQADAQTSLTTAQKEQIVYETANRLPVEVENLTKQGENLEAQKSATEAQTAQTIEQTKRLPYDIEEIQARIANMGKQNLLLEKDYELRTSQLALQGKQLELSTAELEVKRQEIQVQLAAIESQKAQAQLYAQKVITEKAQTQDGVAGENSVLGANVAVLLAQADGYKSDKLQKTAKILVDTWNVRRNSDDGTQANVSNQLHDANVGVAVSGLLVDAGLKPNTSG